MKPRFLVRAASLVCLALAASCDLSTAPPVQHVVDVLLDFCANDTPIWFAYENLNGALTVITPDAQGTYSFTANNRVALAFVKQNGADYRTEIIFTTSAELEQVSGQQCLEETGTKSLNGSVAGLATGHVALVGMNFSSVFLTGNQTFSLTQLNDRPLDLIASRQVLTSNIQLADRIIIRRDQSPLTGTTMPQLDFAGAEFVLAVTPSATVAGLAADDQAVLQNTIFTGQETSHTLSAITGISNGPTSFAAVPAASMLSGDYHDLVVIAVNSDGIRGTERFFRLPGNQTLAVGPTLSAPFVQTVAVAPYLRLRTQLPAQVAYNGSMSVEYVQQQQFSVTTVKITASIGYFGGVNTWQVEIPNLDGTAGWQNAWGLLNTGNIAWTVSGYSGRPELGLGAKPIDGETVNFASRSTVVSPSLGYRVGRPVVPRRGPFTRSR